MSHLIFTAFILLNTSLQAQHNWNKKNWDKQSVGIACSFNAQMTKPVLNFHDLLEKQNHKKIRKLLYSNSPANQFLSVFVLKSLAKRKELELSESEQMRIQQIETSNTLVPVCAGCTYQAEERLSELLQPRNLIYESAKSWFKQYYKIYYK